MGRTTAAEDRSAFFKTPTGDRPPAVIVAFVGSGWDTCSVVAARLLSIPGTIVWGGARGGSGGDFWVGRCCCGFGCAAAVVVVATVGFVKKPPAKLIVGTVVADDILPTVDILLSGAAVAPPLNHAFNWSLSVNEVNGDGKVSLLLLFVVFLESFESMMVPTE